MSNAAAPDVVIVGAGPAGSTLALRLARAGIPVLLLDRHHFPRDKPCGDCLSAAASGVLDDLGVLPEIRAASPARLAGWRVYAPAGHCFSSRFADLAGGGPHAFALPRRTLDDILFRAAIAAGAEVRTGSHVTHVQPGERPRVVVRDARGTHELYPRLVVGADGLRSVVARRVGARVRSPRVHKLSLTAHVNGVRMEHDFGEMHVADGVCAGLAPVGPDLYNLTIVAESERFGRAAAADVHAFFRNALRTFPALPGRLRGAHVHGTPLLSSRTRLLASGPFDRPTRPVAGTGWALVGDAAGYFDPFTGQGILQAMIGSELLARTILERREIRIWTREQLAVYDASLRSLNRPIHRMQRFLDTVLRYPRVADLAIRRLRRARHAASALLSATGDLSPPSSLLSPSVLLSFALPRHG